VSCKSEAGQDLTSTAVDRNAGHPSCRGHGHGDKACAQASGDVVQVSVSFSLVCGGHGDGAYPERVTKVAGNGTGT